MMTFDFQTLFALDVAAELESTVTIHQFLKLFCSVSSTAAQKLTVLPFVAREGTPSASGAERASVLVGVAVARGFVQIVKMSDFHDFSVSLMSD